jgi:hypothetical protein
MPGKPSEPPRPEHPGAPAAAAESAHEARSEQLGPLAIARHVKDDGRALILYSCIKNEPA